MIVYVNWIGARAEDFGIWMIAPYFESVAISRFNLDGFHSRLIAVVSAPVTSKLAWVGTNAGEVCLMSGGSHCKSCIPVVDEIWVKVPVEVRIDWIY